jgi:hypothetical protein
MAGPSTHAALLRTRRSLAIQAATEIVEGTRRRRRAFVEGRPVSSNSFRDVQRLRRSLFGFGFEFDEPSSLDSTDGFFAIPNRAASL